MTSPAAQALGITAGPMLVVSIPSQNVVIYGLIYLGVMTAWAIRRFSRRDL
jgi:hypothetical protein